MGKRIIIQRSSSRVYRSKVATFDADDAAWDNAEDRSRVSLQEFRNNVNAAGAVDVEEILDLRTRTLSRGDHTHAIEAPGHDVAIRVRNQQVPVPFETEANIHVTGLRPNDTVHAVVRNTEELYVPPEDTVNVSFTDAEGNEQRFPEQAPLYTYIYAGGLPIWRCHRITGEVDSAHICDNDMTFMWEIRWMHYPNMTPVHIEHIDKGQTGELDEQDGLVDGRSVTIGDVHLTMHPVRDALTYEERQSILVSPAGATMRSDSTDEQLLDAQNGRAIHAGAGRHNSRAIESMRSASNMRGPYAAEHDRQTRAIAQRNADRIHDQDVQIRRANKAAEIRNWNGPLAKLYYRLRRKVDKCRPGSGTLLEKFRHWQEWSKSSNPPLVYTQRGPLMFRAGSPWITFTYISLYAFWVVIPAYELLQLLNQ